MKKIKTILYRKICIVVLLLFGTLFGCAACEDNRNYESYIPQEGSIFVCVESYTDPYLGDVKILVDKKTRIMYIYCYDSGSDYNFSTNLTVLYESDGKPKKYSGVITD